ncbi:MAG: hypothetical protein HC828_11625 [Blastochloris sp.]|nr:hypothetical protein [Blastochloris sp.]
MPVNLKPPVASQLLPVRGVALGIAQAGIRKANRRDLLLIRLDEGAAVAGVFTQNRFCAAPVIVCREHLASAGIRALVVNTGIANAGTGEPGMQAARTTCVAAARLVGCAPQLSRSSMNLTKTTIWACKRSCIGPRQVGSLQAPSSCSFCRRLRSLWPA